MKTSFCTILLTCLILAACTTAEKRKEQPQPSTEKTSPVPASSPGSESEVENVDFVALQKALGLDRENHKLGYAERSFNTCEVGYGFSKSHNCRQRYFVVVHFRLMCRDSEGTVSEIVRPQDLRANADRSVRWNFKDYNGIASTDGEGYGQIRLVTAQPQKQQRLKLSVAADFLYLKAGEVQKIVTPKNWCE